MPSNAPTTTADTPRSAPDHTPSHTPGAGRHDVLILGAGIIGLACALQLLKAGRGVTLIERGQAGAATSAGSCGTITPSHAPPLTLPGTITQALRWMWRGDAPLYIKPSLNPRRLSWLWHFARRCRPEVTAATTRARAELLKNSRHALAALVDSDQLACEFQSQGTLYVWRNADEFARAQWLPEMLAPLEIPIQSLTGDEARRLEPALNGSIAGAFYHPMDAQVRPELYAAELARRVRELGGVIVENNPVLALESDTGTLTAVHTRHGRYRAAHYVLALGAWSPALGRQLGLNIPVEPGKGYSITFDRPQVCPRIPIVLKERSVCVTAWGSGFRLGSTMEFSGYDEHLNRRRLDALVRAAQEYLHQAHGPHKAMEWFGWRPMTWDELPIIGRSPRHANLTLATGHGMLGVSMSAATGQLVRDIVCQREPEMDITPFRPARFMDRHYH